MFRFLRKGRGRIKTCGLSFETPLLFSSSSPLFLKRRPFLRPRVTHCFLIRTAVRANGHAPAHRAHSEFEILAFTLHLHPQFADTALVVCEGKTFFCRYCPQNVCKLQSSYICGEITNQTKNNEAYSGTKIGNYFRNGLK